MPRSRRTRSPNRCSRCGAPISWCWATPARRGSSAVARAGCRATGCRRSGAGSEISGWASTGAGSACTWRRRSPQVSPCDSRCDSTIAFEVRGGFRLLALLACAAAAPAPPAGAQQPSLTVLLQNGVPRVQATALLADGKFVGLMRSGFPLRLHYRLELWKVRSGWFDQFVREVSWDALARHDPLADDFVLIRTGGSVTRYSSAEALERAIELPYLITLAPQGSGKFYFLCRLEVTTLNDSDLQELERWLKGDVSPAVSGGGSFGDALVRGAQRVLVRIAGLPRLNLEARSAEFRPGRP